ncbi:MAG TPA: family 10 glycosylhydrolase [Candidatus Saccharicenans sp.]|nr:family 10 glycosylhydrolase [Candidatus Saccharicenans sp.]
MRTKSGSRPTALNFIRIKSLDWMRRALIYGVSFIFVLGLVLLAAGNFLLSASAAEANDRNSHDQTSEGKTQLVELSSSKELTEALRLAAELQPHGQLKPEVRTQTLPQAKILLQAEAQAQARAVQAVEVQAEPPAWQVWRQSQLQGQARSKAPAAPTAETRSTPGPETGTLFARPSPPPPSLLPAQAQSKTKSQTKKTKTSARTEDEDAWISGVWMHPGMFGPKQAEALSKMRTVLDDYAKAGINTLIMLVKDTSGYLYYQSDIGVKDPAYDWDFFGVFLTEARQRKMTVHPWFCVFPEGALLGQVRQHPEWLIVGPAREMVRTVNPALPEVRAYEISLMTELVKKYGVDWVHLDYIRFPCEPTEPYFSHDPKTLQLFKDETGIDFNSLKARDSGNPHWNAWLEWNRQQVTGFVKELKDELLTTGRQVRISAAVFPDADNARVLIGQDWEKWAQQGLIDMLCPMLYTNDTALFDRLTKRAVAIGLRSVGDKAQGQVGREKMADNGEGTGSEVAGGESINSGQSFSREEISARQEQTEKRRAAMTARVSGENARPEINIKNDITSDITCDITDDIMSDSHSSGGFDFNSCNIPNSLSFPREVSYQNQQDKVARAVPSPAAVGADTPSGEEGEVKVPAEAKATAEHAMKTSSATATALGKIPEPVAQATLPRKLLVCPGIGLGTSHNQITPDLMLEEIRLARAAGADGVIFFSGSSLTAPFLDRLKNQANQPRSSF